MATVTIYPNFAGSVNTGADATIRCRFFNLMVDCGLAVTPDWSLESYLQDHATEQTIEKVTELEVQAVVTVLGTDMVGYVGAIAIVQLPNVFTGAWAHDQHGFVDNLAEVCSDPWAADILTEFPLQYRETRIDASKVLAGTGRAKYTVPKGQYETGAFSSWFDTGSTPRKTYVLVMVHKAGPSVGAMPLNAEIDCCGSLVIRKSITFNNDTLVGGGY